METLRLPYGLLTVPERSLVDACYEVRGRENGEIGNGGWVSARQTKPWLFQGCHASC